MSDRKEMKSEKPSYYTPAYLAAKSKIYFFHRKCTQLKMLLFLKLTFTIISLLLPPWQI